MYYAVSDTGRQVALKAVQTYEQIELRGIQQCMNLKNPHLVVLHVGNKAEYDTGHIPGARLIELLYAAERSLELAQDPEITGTDVRTIPTETPTEGVGIVEAPRGTLTHHYATDERGLLTKVNLIVGTTNNYAAINMSIKKAAQGLIKAGVEISDAVLNQIEMAFRAYDPCIACATHSLPGRQGFLVRVFDQDMELVQEILRN